MHSKSYVMSKHFAQYTHDFHLGIRCLWMDEKLLVPNTLGGCDLSVTLLPSWKIEYVYADRRLVIPVQLQKPCLNRGTVSEIQLNW